ncbi:family 78 glycoside hydrolase catalytic domain [Bifidobacterium sp. ESL0790]|uniref:family 78 glycoside hydrolase catalytic domain n=1 Tax=Bifidobacterium sp. ESL0790 TaxID=2983233 RepID=UPI0023F98414|nr:family 78 glycoside hydrolase catalytic domain [Bifidobacterium sp. ESL0790]WEV72619.1 family 78 glycoside hydrolase catalytic domain [Bifidobacterium sp. ESL0790]
MIELLINDRVNPVDLRADEPPVLRWRDDGVESGGDVVAYRVVVASSREKAAAGLGDVWDSGEIRGDGFEGVVLSGVPAEPSRRYWVAVRLWRRDIETTDDRGAASDVRVSDHRDAGSCDENEKIVDEGWNAPATFGTWPSEQWRATPIWADAASVPQDAGNSRGWAFMRSEFVLPSKPVAWATLYATGDSTRPARQFVYRLWVNGSFVGCGPVFPIGDEARVDGYDVTALLHPGANALGALAYALDAQRFAAQLDVAFVDGEVRHYATSRDWKAMPGNLVYPDSASIGTQYFEAPAENIESAYYPFGFTQPGFDDSAWPSAVERPAFTRLEPTPTDKMLLRHNPARLVSKLPDGGVMLDFGGTQIGGLRVRPCLANPTRLTIRYGEVKNDDGTVRFHLNTGNVYEDCWHLGGAMAGGQRHGDGEDGEARDDNGSDGAQALETWGMRVFRYVEIHAVPETSAMDASTTSVDDLNVAELLASGQLDVTSSALVYPKTTDAAMFSSSDPTLNEVWSLCARTIEACNGNIYADSWTRERAPYEADAWIQQQCHLALDDAPSLGRYTIDYLIANRTWPTEWPMYLILAVHDWWMHTGDDSQVANQYERLKTLLPERFWNEEYGLIVKDPGESSHTDGDLVDWPQSERDGFVFGRVNTVINALAAQTYSDMADLARILEQNEDADLFSQHAQRIRDGINTWLYDEECAVYCDGLVDVPGRRDTERNDSFAVARDDDDMTGEGEPGDDDASLMDTVRITHHSLHASAFALAFADVPDDRISSVADYLRSRGMACSVYVAAVYLEGLYRNGFGADADALIAAPAGLRTWGNMVRWQGGGTMEAWDPSLKPNLTYSHPWAASPAYLLPEGMLGIRPLEPGYSQFMVMPQLGDVREAEVKVPVRTGVIGVRCERVGSGAVSLADGHTDSPELTSSGCMQITIDVPANCIAEVVLAPQAQGAVDMVLVDGHPSSTVPVTQPMNIAGVRCPMGSLAVGGLEAGRHVVRSVALP